MEPLRISLIQSDIVWENKEQNQKQQEECLKTLFGKTDLVVLPEMFSTGFSMQAKHLAETNTGPTIQRIHSWAKKGQFAVCGSFLAKDDSGNIFNRGFFITPEGDSFYYDKRHLFRLGEENEQFTAGNQKLDIPYKGWNIRLIVCYDLRFPVWCRNQDNAYDLLICPANWPEVRAKVWETLLKARAIENQCYVCGVNRVGEDGNKILHRGDSFLIDFKGEALVQAEANKEEILTGSIDKEDLNKFRKKFPAWKDADAFELK